MDHLRHAVHDLLAAQHLAAGLHQLGDGAAVAGAFQHRGADQRDGFRVVELQAAGQAALGQQRGSEQQQFVFLSRGQLHGALSGGPDTRRACRQAKDGWPQHMPQALQGALQVLVVMVEHADHQQRPEQGRTGRVAQFIE
ncbi:hypothetical protein D9M71_232130 [compost metagenome]